MEVGAIFASDRIEIELLLTSIAYLPALFFAFSGMARFFSLGRWESEEQNLVEEETQSREERTGNRRSRLFEENIPSSLSLSSLFKTIIDCRSKKSFVAMNPIRNW